MGTGDKERIGCGMRKELKYFSIDGVHGGSQDWMSNFLMKFGGCAALAACDTCIYLAAKHGWKNIYPYDGTQLCRDDYDRFAMKMKPYLRPRIGGVDRLSLYIEGFEKYLTDAGVTGIAMKEFSGAEPYEQAEAAVHAQIDGGWPIPCLTLKHKDKTFDDYVWHWYMLTGYKKEDERFAVKAVTYGGARWLDLRGLWETGYEKKGGLVLYQGKVDKA